MIFLHAIFKFFKETHTGSNLFLWMFFFLFFFFGYAVRVMVVIRIAIGDVCCRSLICIIFRQAAHLEQGNGVFEMILYILAFSLVNKHFGQGYQCLVLSASELDIGFEDKARRFWVKHFWVKRNGARDRD